MNLHLIREASLKPEEFMAIAGLLKSYPGPVKFVSYEKPVKYDDDELYQEEWDNERFFRKQPVLNNCRIQESVHITTWQSMFDHCQQARIEHSIPENEPVVLLTAHANEYNWFQGADPSGRQNLFVQTSMWEHFVSTDMVYPVVHQVATIPLKILMYDNFDERVNNAHKEPRGCINDFCINKTEITLKLRTADICPECSARISQRNISHLITNQVLSILEDMRQKFIYYTNLTSESAPARLVLDYRERTITLPELGITLPFGPMEITVYHFFLKHPEGVAFATLPTLHQPELLQLYSHYFDTGTIATLSSRIGKLCADRDNMSNVLSRIRRKIEANIPSAIASYYVIAGDNGMKQRIKLSREFLEII